jgi:hypothetical protein
MREIPLPRALYYTCKGGKAIKKDAIRAFFASSNPDWLMLCNKGRKFRKNVIRRHKITLKCKTGQIKSHVIAFRIHRLFPPHCVKECFEGSSLIFGKDLQKRHKIADHFAGGQKLRRTRA